MIIYYAVQYLSWVGLLEFSPLKIILPLNPRNFRQTRLANPRFLGRGSILPCPCTFHAYLPPFNIFVPRSVHMSRSMYFLFAEFSTGPRPRDRFLHAIAPHCIIGNAYPKPFTHEGSLSQANAHTAFLHPRSRAFSTPLSPPPSTPAFTGITSGLGLVWQHSRRCPFAPIRPRSSRTSSELRCQT